MQAFRGGSFVAAEFILSLKQFGWEAHNRWIAPTLPCDAKHLAAAVVGGTMLVNHPPNFLRPRLVCSECQTRREGGTNTDQTRRSRRKIRLQRPTSPRMERFALARRVKLNAPVHL